MRSVLQGYWDLHSFPSGSLKSLLMCQWACAQSDSTLNKAETVISAKLSGGPGRKSSNLMKL